MAFAYLFINKFLNLVFVRESFLSIFGISFVRSLYRYNNFSKFLMIFPLIIIRRRIKIFCSSLVCICVYIFLSKFLPSYCLFVIFSTSFQSRAANGLIRSFPFVFTQQKSFVIVKHLTPQ